MTIIDGAAILAAGVCLVPGLVLFTECALSLLPRARRCSMASSPGRPRTVVLVPARDEEAVIATTLARLLPELGVEDRLLVVADGCHDRTAALARAAGADVIEREDPTLPGKGHAVAFGLRHLERTPPEVVVIVDADCVVSPGSIDALARHAAATGRPVQAEYVLLASDPASPGALSALAFSLRNRVRGAGLRALGLPCPLVGSGMAFPYDLLRLAPVATSHIVEDLHLGIDMALLGAPPASCSEAKVSGWLPDRADARRSQRRRWEHGHLGAWATRVPGLLFTGIAQGRLDLIGLALDLAVPPIALLVLAQLAVILLGALIALLGGSSVPLALGLTSLALVVGAVALALPGAARGVCSPGVILRAPGYVLSKLPMYLDLLRRGPERRWIRTDRAAESKA